MLSTGNIMPDNKITGNINTTPDINMATICVLTKVDISNPKGKDTKIKMLKSTQSILSYCMVFNTKTDNNRIVVKLMNDNIM